LIRRFAAVTILTALLVAGCARGGSTPGGDPTPVSPTPPAPAPVAQPTAYDLVIRGATVVDGTGSPGTAADVAVTGDKIAFVGKLENYTAGLDMDGKGLVVAPGFINPHSHTHDFINPYEDLDATASLMQGITTEFGGVDGRSPLPIGAELDRLAAAGTGVNFGLFVGQGSVRGKVMGNAGAPANATQLDAMKQLVRQAMEEGAWGVSTGLEYAPGAAAAADEIIALVAESKPYGGLYSTHMRSEGAQVVEALQEALQIGKQAGVPTNLAHLKVVKYPNWGKGEQVARLVEQAIAQGQQVFADVYPYLAPDYAVNRPLAEWAQSLPPEYLVITRANNAALVGQTLAEASETLLLPVDQAIAQLSTPDAGVAVVALVTSENAMLRFYQAPWSVVSTDGEAQPKLATAADALAHSFHRRSYGSYPMFLGHYVRDRKIMSLESAIRKSTGAVADYFGLKDRGYVKPGYYADIVVFDAQTIADRTTWVSPQEYPRGIKHVLVNGVFGVKDGRRQEGRPGRVLRHGK
jgi:N-acyl-D-amino-acid deacylase